MMSLTEACAIGQRRGNPADAVGRTDHVELDALILRGREPGETEFARGTGARGRLRPGSRGLPASESSTGGLCEQAPTESRAGPAPAPAAPRHLGPDSTPRAAKMKRDIYLSLAVDAPMVKRITTARRACGRTLKDWNEPSSEAESASEPALSGDSGPRSRRRRDAALTGRQLGLARDWSSSRGTFAEGLRRPIIDDQRPSRDNPSHTPVRSLCAAPTSASRFALAAGCTAAETSAGSRSSTCATEPASCRFRSIRRDCRPTSAPRQPRLGLETVVLIEGEVVARPEAMRNAELATGDVEVRATALQVVGPATPPAIPVARARNENLAAEELRLRHRFLDLRRPELQANIVLRHRLMQVTRRFLSERGFFEIETPILTKPTPEGARDYLVPSRVHAGRVLRAAAIAAAL